MAALPGRGTPGVRPSLPSQPGVHPRWLLLWRSQILPSSFAADVIPLLGPMTRDDVVIDLGSGTGKLCVQLALETGAGRVRGIEFASRRCDVADEALRRMSGVGSEDLGSAMAKGPVAASLFGSDWEDADTGAVPEEEEEEEAEAQSTAAAITNAAAAGPESARVPVHLEPVIREAATRLSLERGCFIAADLSDVTVAFVNNTVFEPDLMNVSQQCHRRGVAFAGSMRPIRRCIARWNALRLSPCNYRCR